MNRIHIHGAYGRRYATAKAAVADWQAGKDFKIHAGPYTSIRDSEALKADGYSRVAIEHGTGQPKNLPL